MGELNADFINPFLISATKILKDMCFIDLKIGKPYIRDNNIDNESVIIMLGITGELKGQVMIILNQVAACDIAGKMIMTPVSQIDELSGSAICELGNMILGNAATIFSTKGITIDITPPSLCIGSMAFMNTAKSICVPLTYDDNKVIELNIGIV
ncbi:chemotaxis protein CheX [Anaerosporobacter faecicola]|uniref:chemotaxis protein CheX n=1 Tax=Anaerosporobacter faecicola TaxID=2718714 RepID=UPI00143BCD6E|nr:chemotaxis protein CheX [Anaerosporobacter faecicola]